jgi:hypothetical protein
LKSRFPTFVKPKWQLGLAAATPSLLLPSPPLLLKANPRFQYLIAMSFSLFRRLLLLAGTLPRLAQRTPTPSEGQPPALPASSGLTHQAGQGMAALMPTATDGCSAGYCAARTPAFLEERKRLADENSDLRQLLLAQQEKNQAAVESFERHLRGHRPEPR